jgi:predicted nuclease with TOPRIM domain
MNDKEKSLLNKKLKSLKGEVTSLTGMVEMLQSSLEIDTSDIVLTELIKCLGKGAEDILTRTVELKVTYEIMKEDIER